MHRRLAAASTRTREMTVLPFHIFEETFMPRKWSSSDKSINLIEISMNGRKEMRGKAREKLVDDVKWIAWSEERNSSRCCVLHSDEWLEALLRWGTQNIALMLFTLLRVKNQLLKQSVGEVNFDGTNGLNWMRFQTSPSKVYDPTLCSSVEPMCALKTSTK